MSDPPLSDIDFKNKIACVWSPDSGLLLKAPNSCISKLRILYKYYSSSNETVKQQF